MTRIRMIAVTTLAALSLSACGGGGDSSDGIIQITHTTKGALYWE